MKSAPGSSNIIAYLVSPLQQEQLLAIALAGIESAGNYDILVRRIQNESGSFL